MAGFNMLQTFFHHVVPLVDACDTEWRALRSGSSAALVVPLVDACDTEWRVAGHTRYKAAKQRATR